MAITTFTGDMSAFFAAGTTLQARPASNWPAHQRPPAAGTTPVGSVTASAASHSTTGVLSLTGLADSTEYYVSNSAGTRYVRITTFPERQELMTGDVGGTVAGRDTANTFTAAQTVAPSTDVVPLTITGGGVGGADQLVINAPSASGRLLRALNIAPSGHRAGAVVFGGENGRGTAGDAWSMGVDTAASPAYADFFIGKVETGGAVTDVFYMAQNGSNPVNVGIGVAGTSLATNDYRLNVGADTSRATQGTLRLTQSTGNSGKALLIENTTPTTVFSVGIDGATFVKSNSATALKLVNSSNTVLFNVDGSGGGEVLALGKMAIGAGAVSQSVDTLQLLNTGSSDTLLGVRTASWGNVQIKAQGASPGLCSMMTTNGTPLGLGANSVIWQRITTTGNVIVGKGALASPAEMATSATDGFLHIPTTNGAPTAAPPTTVTGAVPICMDRTNFKLYAYMGGAWKSTAAFA